MITLLADFETSAQHRHSCGIVEIAAAWVGCADPLAECFQIQCRPRPGSLIDPDSIAFNGSAEWINSPWIPHDDVAVARFAQWIYETCPLALKSLDLNKGQGILLAGWNVAVFDWIILERIWKDSCTAIWPFSFRTLDLHAMAVMDMTRRGIHVPDSGLTSALVCEVYGITPEPKPHRAMGGVRFESELYAKLMEVS